MDANQWRRVAALAERAVQLDDPERRRFLNDAADGDAELEGLLDRTVALVSRADVFARDLAADLAMVLRDGAAPLVGSRLGAYRLDRLLGQGGMGLVYLAHRADDHYQKTVAVKVLPDTVGSPADREQFAVERQLLARLEHPAIARLVDGGVSDGGHPYYVLEYVEGQPVDEYVRAASLRETLAVFVALCEGVAHGHGRLVVHCDVKPANVVVTPEGVPKLLDFGIARQPGAARRGPLTRPYAAPELLAAEPVDARTDVYSLGVLLRELLTGSAAAGPSAELPATGRLQTASRLLRRELAAVVAKATAEERDARYGGVPQLIQDVAAVLASRPLATPPPGVVAYGLRRAVARRPGVVGLVGAALVFGLLLVLGMGDAMRDGRQHRRRLAMHRDVAEALLDCATLRFSERASVTGAEALAACEVDGHALGRRGVEYLARLAGLAHRLGEPEVAERVLATLRSGPPMARRRADVLRHGMAAEAGAAGAEAALRQAILRCEAIRDIACTHDGLRALRRIYEATGRTEALPEVLRRADATRGW
ncbi:MAG: serine/threonine-protein kinase [Myxococcota bacterium]